MFFSIGHCSTPPLLDTRPIKSEIYVDLFTTSTCPYCQKADFFFNELQKKKSWLHVHRYDIDTDKSALEQFYQRLQVQKNTSFAVPAIFFCGSHWIGFDDTEITRRNLLSALNYCRQKIVEQGRVSKNTTVVLQQKSTANQIQFSPAITESPFKMIFFTAIVDIVNTCSLFLLITLIGFIGLSKKSKTASVLTMVGLIVPIITVSYVAQLFPDVILQLIKLLRIPAFVVGIMLLYVGLYYLKKNVVTQRVIPWFINSSLLMITSLIILLYQQSVGLNVGLVFQQWMVNTDVSMAQSARYQLLYFSLVIMPVILLIKLIQFLITKMQTKGFKNRSRIFSSIFIIAVGSVFILYPPFLNNPLVSLIVILLALFLSRRGYEQ